MVKLGNYNIGDCSTYIASEWKPKTFKSCSMLPLVLCFHSSGKIQYGSNRSKLVIHSVSKPKRKFTGLGLRFFGNQDELPPMHAAREYFPPLVEGGDPLREHDVEFFQEAQAAGFAGGVVAGLPVEKLNLLLYTASISAHD